MTEHQAAEILAAHNAWRRHDSDDESPSLLMQDPKALGAAIDVAVRALAECEQLRADAARYRWLRTFPNNISRAVYGATMVCDSGLLMRDTYLDEAIDAAMKETK